MEKRDKRGGEIFSSLIWFDLFGPDLMLIEKILFIISLDGDSSLNNCRLISLLNLISWNVHYITQCCFLCCMAASELSKGPIYMFLWNFFLMNINKKPSGVQYLYLTIGLILFSYISWLQHMFSKTVTSHSNIKWITSGKFSYIQFLSYISARISNWLQQMISKTTFRMEMVSKQLCAVVP